eukprot:364699-Chlamydomonas_euryale.AAC.5
MSAEKCYHDGMPVTVTPTQPWATAEITESVQHTCMCAGSGACPTPFERSIQTARGVDAPHACTHGIHGIVMAPRDSPRTDPCCGSLVT